MEHQVSDYVHGYETGESARLEDQASALASLLHADTVYPPGSRILEVGCGVGAQTVRLARSSPGIDLTAIDISEASLAAAEARARAAGLDSVRFVAADIFDLPFARASFDHIFVCFVLEHLAEPLAALRRLRPLLREGGTITVVEGDHGTVCLHPESDAAHAAIGALVALQRAAGGDPNIGRRLYPLLMEAGFAATEVSPRMVYADGGRPEMADLFTRRTFAAMIAGVREPAIEAGLVEAERFDAGIRALHRAAEPDGTFCYTFFKAVAVSSAA